MDNPWAEQARGIGGGVKKILSILVSMESRTKQGPALSVSRLMTDPGPWMDLLREDQAGVGWSTRKANVGELPSWS